jgi:glutathione synthase/RimK-type ligase-like ATP-grasp enzyme
MGKLLVLVDSIGFKKELFAKMVAEEMGSRNMIELREYSDLTFEISEGKIMVNVGLKGGLITDYDFVYFRRAGNGHVFFAAAVAVALDFLGIKYVDSSYGILGRSGDKFTHLIRFAGVGLPVMPTFFSCSGKILENFQKIKNTLGIPFVAKDMSSQRGRGVFLIKSKKGFENLVKNYPDRRLLFQKFYEGKNEYRILVLGDTIGAFEEKIRVNMADFRANVSLGAREKFMDPKKIPNVIKKISLKACKLIGVEIGGVDVLVDTKGKAWLLEVNRGPGLTYDKKVSPEFASLGKYFQKKLSQK